MDIKYLNGALCLLLLVLCTQCALNTTSITRKTDYPIEQLFLKRWSSRAFSDKDISHKELMTLFDAARWAPSSYNNQPWRFLYVTKKSPNWNQFFDLLVDFNKQWAKNASALVLVLSSKNYEHNDQPAITHSFDAGAAVENLALQGAAMNIVVHPMEGFDYDRARKELSIPDNYAIEAMLAIGKPGATKSLPASLQEKEVMSDRKPLEQIAFEGQLPKAS
jgi:nitroreductase